MGLFCSVSLRTDKNKSLMREHIEEELYPQVLQRILTIRDTQSLYLLIQPRSVLLEDLKVVG